MASLRTFALILCWLASGPAAVIRAESPTISASHWVWNRTAPLSADEAKRLRATGAKQLWWNVGTLERDGTQWKGAASFAMPAAPEGIRILPVVRLHHSAQTLAEPAADSALIELLTRASRHFGGEVLQVDYDCPDRLLGRYAEVLAKLRLAIAPTKLHVTALANWPRVTGFPELCASVDGIAPMFYDLETDDMTESPDGARPMMDATTLAAQIATWKTCATAWDAGLPNFTRVTLFDARGKPKGHLGEWRWEDLVFHPALRVERETQSGTTILKAIQSVTLGKTLVSPGEQLVVRWADPGMLHKSVIQAQQAGARGLIFFKLPELNAPGGWSLETVSTFLDQEPGKIAPQLELAWTDNKLELRNTGPLDLPPRFGSAGHRTSAPASGATTSPGFREGGWTFELDLSPASVLELQPGAFSFRDTLTETISQRVTLRFASLRAYGKIISGYIQVNKRPSEVRWRIPELSPLWQRAVLSPQ
jgi:hypothetical protein